MSTTFRITLYVMIFTFLSKLLGFLREIILASLLGVTMYTDAYIISTTIPAILFNMILGSISHVYMPLFLNIRHTNGEEEALKLTNNLLNISTLASCALCVLTMLFTRQIVRLFALGFDEYTLDIAVTLTRIISPTIITLSITNILRGYLRSNNSFLIPSMIYLPTNIIIIISIVLGSVYSISIMAYGTLIGIGVQSIILIYFSFKKQYTYQFIIDFKDKNIKKTIKLLIPVFLGAAVKRINTLIDKSLASTLKAGSVSALNFAHKIDLFFFGVFSVSISTVMYRKFSLLKVKENKQGLVESISNSIIILAMILMPISIGIMVLSEPIVKLLFQRGLFDTSATYMTSLALFYYSIGITGSGLREILVKIFYSFQDTKTPMKNGVIAVVLNIILNFILIRVMGHGGLALATSISSIVGVFLLLISLKQKIPELKLSYIFSVMSKILISSSIMGIVVSLINNINSIIINNGYSNVFFGLVINFIIGFFSYVLIVKLFKIQEFNILISIVRNEISSLRKRLKPLIRNR